MRSRVLMILFFPVFVLLFLLGWVLYVVGDRETSGKAVSGEKVSVQFPEDESTSNEEGLEVGIIEEIVEEQFAD